MTHEKEFILPDGGKALIKVNLYIGSFSEGARYSVDIATKRKGKRNYHFISQGDDYKYRALSMEQRVVSDMNLYLTYVTKEQIRETALELWDKLKPQFI